MKKKIFYTTFLIFIFIICASCSRDKKSINEDFINLYPNQNDIKKYYFKYSTLNPFYPNDSLFTPIGPRHSDKTKARALIKDYQSYNLSGFYKYIIKKMNGQYISYIYANDVLLFRYYIKIYKAGEKRELKTNEEIEKYFNEKKINYTFIKNKPHNLSIYKLERAGNLPPSYCVINSDEEKLRIYLTYNINDTIKSFPSMSIRPFLSDKIED